MSSTLLAPSSAPPRPQPRASSPARLVLPVAIVLLGAVLRCSRLEWAQYRRDDAIVLGLATQALAAHRLPWVGMISTLGIDNGPAQVWIAMLGAPAGPSPFAAEWLVALLNVVGIAACYAFGKAAFGRRVGLIAALLLAVSSWSVLYSRRLWGNDMAAPFAALCLWSLAGVMRRGDRSHQVLVWLWAALLAQVYVVALVQLPAVALGLLAAARQRKLRPLPTLLGAALFLLLVTPYALGTVLPGLGHLGRLTGGGQAAIDATSIRFLGQTVGLDAYQYYLPQLGRLVDAQGRPLVVISALAAGLPALGIGLALWRIANPGALPPGGSAAATRRLLAVTLAWAALPVLATLRHSVDLFPHYVLGAVPATYVLMALALEALLAAGPLRTPVAAGLAVLVTAQLAVAAVFLGDVPNYVRGTEYGLPLRDVEVLAAAAQQAVARHHAGQVLVIGHYDGAEMGEALRTWLPNVSVIDDQASLRIPAQEQQLVLLTTRDDSPIVEFLRAAGAGQEYHFPGDDTTFRLFAFSTQQLRAAAARQMPAAGPLTFGGDVRLEGSALPAAAPAGTPLQWSARWVVTEQGARDRPVASVFLHLVTTGDAKVAGHDQAFDNHADQWHAGDEVLTWLAVPLPAGVAAGTDRAEVGLYRLRPDGGIDALAGAARAQVTVGSVTIVPPARAASARAGAAG